MAEAAQVCLEDQAHATGTLMGVDGDYRGAFSLVWDDVTGQMRRCYADERPATEHGAYGIAILLILQTAGLTVVERARRGTGYDFWLGPENGPEPLFQRKARLEVSGIRKGLDRELDSRVKEKLKQTEKSSDLIPGFVVVVEFGRPKSRVVSKCRK